MENCWGRECTSIPRLETIFGDTKYTNHALEAWMAENRPGWRIEVHSRPPSSKGFTPIRKRWVVERTNAWNGRSRRNSKDYERNPQSAAAMIQISNLHLMLRKLAPSAQREFRYAAAACASLKKLPAITAIPSLHVLRMEALCTADNMQNVVPMKSDCYPLSVCLLTQLNSHDVLSSI